MTTMESNGHPSGQSKNRAFIAAIPKAELHVHLEGCLHPELIQRLATRNGVTMPMEDTEYLVKENCDLDKFLKIYLTGIQAMVTEDDFYEVVCDYADKVAEQKVMHVEMFFDPQAHLERGVELNTIIAGIRRAANYARAELDMSLSLIMCFLRDKSVDSAMRVLLDAAPFKDIIKGVGLDGDPTKSLPREFKSVFQKAREMGFLATAHCDVMPSESIEQIRQALEDLKVDRLDHASCILEDESLAASVKDKQIGITCCPKTGVLMYHDTEASLIRQMLARGMKCSVNSDDPGYFDAYVNENLQAMSDEGLPREDIIQLARNSIESSWAPAERKRIILNALDSYITQRAVSIA